MTCLCSISTGTPPPLPPFQMVVIMNPRVTGDERGGVCGLGGIPIVKPDLIDSEAGLDTLLSVSLTVSGNLLTIAFCSSFM